jgi:hypothetical protein
MTETRSLGVYELAYLAGGPRRAVEAAVVALVEAGVLRVTRPTGELVLLRRRPCPDLEAAVLDVVGFRGSRRLVTVCWRLRADVRLTGIGRRLQADGLLADGDGLESLRAGSGRCCRSPAPGGAPCGSGAVSWAPTGRRRCGWRCPDRPRCATGSCPSPRSTHRLCLPRRRCGRARPLTAARSAATTTTATGPFSAAGLWAADSVAVTAAVVATAAAADPTRRRPRVDAGGHGMSWATCRACLEPDLTVNSSRHLWGSDS